MSKEKTILYYVKKELCSMIQETEQKIKVWQDKKEEVLKKHPDHRLSELRQLKQYLYVYQLYLNKLNEGLTYKEINSCYYEIKQKFIEQFPEVKTVGCIDLLIPQPVVSLYRKNWAVIDGHINFGESLSYKLQTYYEAKDLGYNGIEVLDEILYPIASYTLDEFLLQDFNSLQDLTFNVALLDENNKPIRSSFASEEYNISREEYVKKREQERFEWKIKATEMELPVEGVVCLNNGLVFKHASNAANYAGLKSASGIRKCCKNMQTYAGKHPTTGEKLQWTTYKNYFENSSNN